MSENSENNTVIRSSHRLKKPGQRERGRNFCSREKDLLIDLLLPHKSIIENVKVSIYLILNSR